MAVISLYKRILIRTIRTLTGNKGVYCKKGKKNHIASGTILYEPCMIGNYNYFAPYSLVYNAKIGNYCSIGPGCKIGLANHDTSAISTRSIINNGDVEMELFCYDKPTMIDNDVWLGANVVVKQGVHIGTGAVIGANSVVTKDIEPYTIAVGIPAKILRKRFDDETIGNIINSEWFLKDLNDAKETVRGLHKQIKMGDGNERIR